MGTRNPLDASKSETSTKVPRLWGTKQPADVAGVVLYPVTQPGLKALLLSMGLCPLGNTRAGFTSPNLQPGHLLYLWGGSCDSLGAFYMLLLAPCSTQLLPLCTAKNTTASPAGTGTTSSRAWCPPPPGLSSWAALSASAGGADLHPRAKREPGAPVVWVSVALPGTGGDAAVCRAVLRGFCKPTTKFCCKSKFLCGYILPSSFDRMPP